MFFVGCKRITKEWKGSVFLQFNPPMSYSLKSKGVYFSEFRPISCCNVIYKLIAKILSRRLKLVLSDLIAEEQFNFLQNKKIHDVILIGKEFIYSMKKKK